MRTFNLEELLKMGVILGAVISFLWGVLTYFDARKLESTRPFLEKQLALYSEASRTTSIISTSKNNEEIIMAKEKFWKLYWGELAMVENRDVEQAMKKFGDALEKDANQNILQQYSLQVAKACRYSLDKSWGINAWSTPDNATKGAAN